MFDDSGEGRKGVAAPPQKGKEEEEKKNWENERNISRVGHKEWKNEKKERNSSTGSCLLKLDRFA
jgi:hypothetical protein